MVQWFKILRLKSCHWIHKHYLIARGSKLSHIGIRYNNYKCYIRSKAFMDSVKNYLYHWQIFGEVCGRRYNSLGDHHYKWTYQRCCTSSSFQLPRVDSTKYGKISNVNKLRSQAHIHYSDSKLLLWMNNYTVQDKRQKVMFITVNSFFYVILSVVRYWQHFCIILYYD